MDYIQLAEEFLSTMSVPGKLKHQRGSMRSDNFILFFISGKRALLPKEISDELGITSARVAKVLNDLESDELITREINPNDRRQIIVTITEKGLKKAEEQRMLFIKKAAKLFEALGEHDAKEYVRIMKRIQVLHKRPCEDKDDKSI